MKTEKEIEDINTLLSRAEKLSSKIKTLIDNKKGMHEIALAEHVGFSYFPIEISEESKNKLYEIIDFELQKN